MGRKSSLRALCAGSGGLIKDWHQNSRHVITSLEVSKYGVGMACSFTAVGIRGWTGMRKMIGGEGQDKVKGTEPATEALKDEAHRRPRQLEQQPSVLQMKT
jgi:hypothetical protein